MGLIKAIAGAAGGVLADQWKEFFYCDSIANDILIVKGQKRTSSRSSNTKGGRKHHFQRFRHRGCGRTVHDDRGTG